MSTHHSRSERCDACGARLRAEHSHTMIDPTTEDIWRCCDRCHADLIFAPNPNKENR